MRLYRILAGLLFGRLAQYRLAFMDDIAELSEFLGPIDIDFLKNSGGGGSQPLSKRHSDNIYHFVATIKKFIVGAVVVARDFDDSKNHYLGWWMFGLLIGTRFRGMGIGQTLVRMALAKVGEEETLHTLVFSHNRAAINLYKKMGFFQLSIPRIDEQLEEEAKLGYGRRIILSHQNRY